MKWNFIIAVVTFASVFLAVGIPHYQKLQSAGQLATVPPGSAFLIAAIFAAGAAAAAFIVSYVLQRYGFVL